jgi:cytidine deaminase
MLIPFSDLSHGQKELLRAAAEARTRAYAPYSNFLVGAALVTGAGKTYFGTNLENASYGLTLCAEATCLGQAVSAGDFDVRCIAIVGGPRAPRSPDNSAPEPVTPCGRCRQLLAEAAHVSNTDVLVISGEPTLSAALILPISLLLPYSFSLALPRTAEGP